jgi:hypothetical protein
MLSTNVGGIPGLELFLQQQLLLLSLAQEQEEEQETIVRGVSWLRDRLSTSKADSSGAPPEVDAWTCPRCRSHRCIRVNPGNVEDPVYCCSVCGYRFHKASATHSPDSAD